MLKQTDGENVERACMIVDDREPKPNKAYPNREDICVLLERRGVNAAFKRLDVGDYQWWGSDGFPVLVSRKSSDLLPSIFSNHFQEELTSCINFTESAGGGHIWTIVEGPWSSGNGLVKHYKSAGANWFKKSSEHRTSPRILAGLYTSLHLSGIGVLYTSSIAETADALAVLWERSQQGWPTEFLSGRRLPQLKRTSNTKVAKLMMLTPRLPEKVAIAMLKEFGSLTTIMELVHDDPARLTLTKGFGKTMLANLKESVS